MSDPIETAAETVRNLNGVNVPTTAAAVVGSLAIYGTYELTRKAVSKVAGFRENRKADKAVKKEDQENATPES